MLVTPCPVLSLTMHLRSSQRQSIRNSARKRLRWGSLAKHCEIPLTPLLVWTQRPTLIHSLYCQPVEHHEICIYWGVADHCRRVFEQDASPDCILLLRCEGVEEAILGYRVTPQPLAVHQHHYRAPSTAADTAHYGRRG